MFIDIYISASMLCQGSKIFLQIIQSKTPLVFTTAIKLGNISDIGVSVQVSIDL